MTMIPCSSTFDQQTLTLMLEHDPVVQRYRTFFALFEWRVVPEPPLDPSQPGKRAHPQRAYIKALLLKVEEDLTTCTHLRRFLVEHPLLVLELGFRPVLDVSQPYGFDVERTVPTAPWLREEPPTLEQPVLQALPLESILAEYTQPFNENDITSFVPLYIRTVATLGFFPTHITADAAFDAWYTYQTVVHRSGIAAIALNQHGHPESRRDADGVPLCIKGFRMHPTSQFSHTYGYLSQRFRCPLLFPQPTGQTCDEPQFVKEKGCVKDLNWELGGQMRVTLNRDGPRYKGIYKQRTSSERGNSQSKAAGLERPKVRNIHSVRNLNTLTYLVINARALQRARRLNASLLTTMLGKVL